MAERTVKFEIKRQSGPDGPVVWDNFELPYRPGMNVISSLRDIAANPTTTDGRASTPITYDSNCLEEICGSCSMLINGKARMACSALVDKLEQPIKLEPLSKFPVVRDLSVDRGVLFENLKRIKAWVPLDGTYDLGSGPRVTPQAQGKIAQRTNSRSFRTVAPVLQLVQQLIASGVRTVPNRGQFSAHLVHRLQRFAMRKQFGQLLLLRRFQFTRLTL